MRKRTTGEKIKKLEGEAKRTRRSPKPYKLPDRATALVMLDFFEGNVARACRVLGMDERTLKGFRDENAENPDSPVTAMRREGGQAIAGLFMRVLEAMFTFALMKAGDATFKDLYYMIGIVADKTEDINRRLEASAPGSASRPLDLRPAPEPVPAPEPAPAPDSFMLEQSRWEGILATVLDEAAAQGETIEREDAITSIVKSNPEAAAYFETAHMGSVQ